MDTLRRARRMAWLVALQPMNLLFALIGVLLGTASACCPASARR